MALPGFFELFSWFESRVVAGLITRPVGIAGPHLVQTAAQMVFSQSPEVLYCCMEFETLILSQC